LKLLNRELTEPIIPDDKLVIPAKDKPWSWSDFEDLLGYYHRALVGAIIDSDNAVMGLKAEISRLKERQSCASSKEEQDNINTNLATQQEALKGLESNLYCPLSQVFRDAIGHENLLRRQVKLEKLEVFKEAAKCLVGNTDLLPFSDKIICQGGQVDIEVERENGLFHCMDGCANIDYRWIMKSQQGNSNLVLLQCKNSKLDTTNRTFSHGDLKKWYDMIVNSASSFTHLYQVVVVIVTNRKYNPFTMEGRHQSDEYGQNGISDMPNLLLIDESCLGEYLSPTFAYRGLLAIPDDFQPEQILTVPSNNSDE
ncbi:hypothetical protein BGX26_007969, partial [Mortierella sp. AD094]